MNINAIIIEDERDAQEVLLKLLSAYNWINIVEVFSRANKGLDYLKEQPVDLIFLDIQMPGMNAFEFLDDIQKFENIPDIIFTTAHQSHALKAIKHHAFDYLLKPIDQDEMASTLNDYQKHFESHHFGKKLEDLIAGSNHPEKIKINTRSGFLWLNQNEILYCEADSNYTTIHLTYSRKEVTSYNLGRVEKLLASESFKRVGRSHIININYLLKVDRKLKICQLSFEGEVYEIPISEGVNWD